MLYMPSYSINCNLFFIVVTCASPASVINASMTPVQATYEYTDTITYTCATGYQRTSGDLSRSCSASGIWSGSEPVCTRKLIDSESKLLVHAKI